MINTPYSKDTYRNDGGTTKDLRRIDDKKFIIENRIYCEYHNFEKFDLTSIKKTKHLLKQNVLIGVKKDNPKSIKLEPQCKS